MLKLQSGLVILLFAQALAILPQPIHAQSVPGGQTTNSGTTQVANPFQEPVTEALEEESEEEDITYLTSRSVYRYDYKSQQGDSLSNRFRLKGIFAFGDFKTSRPLKRFDVAITIPILSRETPADAALGLSDVEAQFGTMIHKRERFRDSATIEFALRTSTDNLLRFSTPTVKPAWGLTALLTPRLELNCVFNYKRSIRSVSGTPKNEFEPDFTLNMRRIGATWRIEWDSFYLIIPERFAQTLKVGASRRFGKRHSWVVYLYYSFPVNDAGRQTQYIHNVGMDVSWSLAHQQ